MKPLHSEQRTMSLRRLTREFVNGDETSWESEREWLLTNQPRYMATLTADIASNGIHEPVRLCYNERRVIDGHHRIIAAMDAGLTRVPVADAWEDDGWIFRAPDPRPIEVNA